MYKDLKGDYIKFWPKDKKISYENFISSIIINLNLTKKTKICSMGSCFGREVKAFLIAKGYNYMLGEQNKPFWSPGSGVANPRYHASVCWERVYTTFTFLNIMQYTFEEKEFNRWLPINSGKKKVMDLVRNYIFYPSLSTAKTDLIEHISESKRVLSTADLLIFTLGLTEIWEHLDRGFAIGGYNKFCIPENLRFRVSRYHENLENLEKAYLILKKNNPNIKLLLTVSPIPLNGTFRKDCDVFTANCNSKSTLVAVANEFVSNHSNDNVFYFPSYELATTILPMLQNRKVIKKPTWRHDDNRHLTEETVRLVMKAFKKKCLNT